VPVFSLGVCTCVSPQNTSMPVLAAWMFAQILSGVVLALLWLLLRMRGMMMMHGCFVHTVSTSGDVSHAPLLAPD
jgi:hypothetical protein